LPFDKSFDHELRAEWLKAPRAAEELRVDPERRFFTPPSKAGFGAVEWVNRNFAPPTRTHNNLDSLKIDKVRF